MLSKVVVPFPGLVVVAVSVIAPALAHAGTAKMLPVALTLPAVTLPVTANAPSVPTEVIVVWAAVLSVPAMPVALTLPAVMLPVTANAVSVPTEVIVVWAAVPIVP